MTTIDLFRNATDAESFSAGQTIFSTGEPGQLMYVVQVGEVRIAVGDTLLETAGPGAIIGEMALIDQAARSATAIALTDCKLVPIDQARFLFLVQHTPFFAIQVMRIMAERLRRRMSAAQ